MAKRACIEALENRRLLSVVVSGMGRIQTAGGPTPGWADLTNNDTTPSPLDATQYGPAGVGSSLVTRSYRVRNTGTTAVNITGVSFTGMNATDFTVVSAPATSIGAGASTQFIVRFRPNAAGVRNANLRIASNDAVTPLFNVAIQGTGATLINKPDGLQIGTITAGSGTGAVNGQYLQMNYTGYLTNGFMFDSSQPTLVPGRTPFNVLLGGNTVIAGWTEGLVGMKVGEKRVLIIPPSLGYGSNDNGNIPANSTLIFETELLSLQPYVMTMNGNGKLIAAGDMDPRPGDNTDFGFSTPGAPITKTFTLVTSDLGQLLVADSQHPFALSGAGASKFTVQGFTVSGNNVNFTISYNPTAPGVDQATVAFASNNPVMRSYAFGIRGQMLGQGVSYTSNALTVTGTDGVDNISLTNSGTTVTLNRNGVRNVFPISQLASVNISGGAGNDTISIGTGVRASTISGNGGGDVLSGGDGNDTIYGNGGSDSISGGAGNDIMYGANGNDTIKGAGGNDSIYGQAGLDQVYGGAGTDLLDGGLDNDIFFAIDALKDTLVSGGGADKAYVDKLLDSAPGISLL